jgi:outer membrane protein OmpA-like peptidoglycan-associated protein
MGKHIWTFFLIVSASSLLSDHSHAQGLKLCPASASKKAEKYFSEAKEARKDRKDIQTIKNLILKAAEEDSSWAEPWLFLGDAARIKSDFKTMKMAYARLIEICPDADAAAYYHLGTYLYDTRNYDESVKYLKGFLDFGSDKEEWNKESETLLFRAKMIASPVPFNPQPLKGVSTHDPEYLAVISPDQDFCFFTRRFDEIRRGSLTPQSVEKFMVSRKQPDGGYDKGEPMPSPFNLSATNNEGGATVSKDNRFIYFTRNENGNFDIFYSEMIKGKWSEITSLGSQVNDPRQWDSQPSLSSDGKTLYFASYRDSVNGTSDIFVTKKVNGTFGKPERLSFCTNGNEKSPYIHPDNITLYFSSDSLPGMGGFDIYMVKKDVNGKWGKPVNLGYPINTEADEVGFFVSTDGQKGFFASNSIKGAGGYDIYSFDLPEGKKPEKVLFVKGQLKNDQDSVPLAAKIELRNVITSEIIDVDYDTTTGNYSSVVLFDADYIMTVKKEGYAYNSQYFSEEDTTIKGVVSNDMEVRKIEVGQAYNLNDIRFETNSSALNKGSKVVIQDFAAFLKENPKVTVAIHGHTDSEGDPAMNMKLSADRAKAVYDQLVANGILSSRLQHKGFGQTKPVSSNETSEGRAKNRRTEFVINGK